MPFGNRVAANLRTMAAAVARLKRRGVRLAVFPECCLSGYMVAPEQRDWPAIQAGVERLRELARAKKMALIFGTAWPSGGRRPFNSVLAADERGRVVARYDKCHLIRGDRKCFAPGRRLFRVIRLAGVRLAMQICFDSRFPEAPRLAALAGAQLITYSFAGVGKNNWKLPVLEGTLRCRAAENGVFVCAANAAHRVMIVASRILDPEGRDLAAARPGRAAEIVAAINPAKAHHSYLRQRRPDLYQINNKI
jgi:predicted amidohydrolase